MQSRSAPISRQNSAAPQLRQKQRSAPGEERTHASPSLRIRWTWSAGAAPEAQTWPLNRRHWLQWQTATGSIGPWTRKATAPLRQEP